MERNKIYQMPYQEAFELGIAGYKDVETLKSCYEQEAQVLRDVLQGEDFITYHDVVQFAQRVAEDTEDVLGDEYHVMARLYDITEKMCKNYGSVDTAEDTEVSEEERAMYENTEKMSNTNGAVDTAEDSEESEDKRDMSELAEALIEDEEITPALEFFAVSCIAYFERIGAELEKLAKQVVTVEVPQPLTTFNAEDFETGTVESDFEPCEEDLEPPCED